MKKRKLFTFQHSVHVTTFTVNMCCLRYSSSIKFFANSLNLHVWTLWFSVKINTITKATSAQWVYAYRHMVVIYEVLNELRNINNWLYQLPLPEGASQAPHSSLLSPKRSPDCRTAIFCIINTRLNKKMYNHKSLNFVSVWNKNQINQNNFENIRSISFEL